jgi:hypothetical protein
MRVWKTGQAWVTYSNNIFNFGTDDFTINFDFMLDGLPTSGNKYVIMFYAFAVTSVSGWFIELRNTGGVYSIGFVLKVDGSVTIDTSVDISISALTKYNLEIARNGSNFYTFLDGQQQGAAYISAGSISVTGTKSMLIGSYSSATGYIGNLDEIHMSYGIARNTSSFTVSTERIFPDEYTFLLLHCEGTNGSSVFKDYMPGDILNLEKSFTTSIKCPASITVASVIREFIKRFTSSIKRGAVTLSKVYSNKAEPTYYIKKINWRK